MVKVFWLVCVRIHALPSGDEFIGIHQSSNDGSPSRLVGGRFTWVFAGDTFCRFWQRVESFGLFVEEG